MASAPSQPSSASAVIEERYDIVVAGGALGATAAALMAARTNPHAHVLLTEPTDWLGGQATSQGVAAPDNAWHDPGATLEREQPALHYAKDYLEFLERIEEAPAGAPGTGWAGEMACWVSRHAFDPRTAAWALDEMAAAQPNLTVRKMTVVKAVETAPVSDRWGTGRRITAITFIERAPRAGYKPFTKRLSQEIGDWYAAADSADFLKRMVRVTARDAGRGLVVIDGSELADVVVLSGAVYTIGREKTAERIADDGALPECDERGAMACVFPFAMRLDAKADPESDIRAEFPDFEEYYKKTSEAFYSLKTYSWERVWTYRRLFTTGGAWQHDTVFMGDVSMQNWNPGNDYLEEMFYKTKAECTAEADDWRGGVVTRVLADMERHALGWYVWMKERRPAGAPGADTRLCRGDDPLNMMGTRLGLAKFPYIRDQRRIAGLDNFRIYERYFVPVTGDAKNFPRSSFRYFDTVGIGSYAADIRPVKGAGIAPKIEKPAPFYIPYRALGSVNVRNLLAAGKLYSQSYIANSAYRLHPIEWNAGTAAGAAAALMARDGAANYELLQISRLRELQRAVLVNAPLGWAPYDAGEPIPARNGDIVVNDNQPLGPAELQGDAPVTVEVFHPAAVKTAILFNGALAGEAAGRRGGRLMATVTLKKMDMAAAAKANPSADAIAAGGAWSAVLYDDEGLVIDRIEPPKLAAP